MPGSMWLLQLSGSSNGVCSNQRFSTFFTWIHHAERTRGPCAPMCFASLNDGAYGTREWLFLFCSQGANIILRDTCQTFLGADKRGNAFLTTNLKKWNAVCAFLVQTGQLVVGWRFKFAVRCLAKTNPRVPAMFNPGFSTCHVRWLIPHEIISLEKMSPAHVPPTAKLKVLSQGFVFMTFS